ncbi:hypothetical protein KCP70_21540 [Salmonella enterica subsp. enterica]|nr:hypothetical protein KCP70_21540 [Salmonella enterica subsp. enterica]
MQDTLCWNTDTAAAVIRINFFRVAKSAQTICANSVMLIAEWSRLSYGWMGTHTDIKPPLACALGANPAFYGQFEQNARNWYTRIQETGLYFNHAMSTAIDRQTRRRSERRLISSWRKRRTPGCCHGRKLSPLTPPLTHYNMDWFRLSSSDGRKPGFLPLMFVAPMDATPKA